MTSHALATMILAFCPGYEMDHGQVITTSCQERMVNCVINKAGQNEPTKREVDSCIRELKSKYGSTSEIPASSLLDKKR